MSGALPATNTAVLDSFAIEQRGGELRVTDSDGSVYSGYLRADELATAAGRLGKDAQVSHDAAPVVANSAGTRGKELIANWQNYSFRVSGTNRSLKQSVVFFGNLVAATNALDLTARAYRMPGAGAIPAAPGQGPQVSQPLLLNSRIDGTALINNLQKIEVKAAPSADTKK